MTQTKATHAGTSGEAGRSPADRASGARRRHRARGQRHRRRRPRGRRGLLQHRDDRLPGDPHRPLLCRADHHLHLPAHRQCRHQRRGHRDRQHGGDAGRARRDAADATSPTPSNYRATRHLDHWLKARGIIGIAGIDTRALTAPHPRQGHAQRRHRPRARRPVRSRRAARRKRAPGRASSAWTSCRWSPPASASPGTRRRGSGTRATAGRTSREFHVVAIDYGIKRNILRLLAGTGCKVTVVPANDLGRRHPRAQARRRVPVQRPGRSGGDRRIRRAGDQEADRLRHADLRHLPRPPDARHRARRHAP